MRESLTSVFKKVCSVTRILRQSQLPFEGRYFTEKEFSSLPAQKKIHYSRRHYDRPSRFATAKIKQPSYKILQQPQKSE